MRYKDIRKEDNGIEPFVHHLFKPVIHLLVWIFASINVTPNQISFLSLIMGIFCAYFFLLGSLVFGALFCLLRYLFDAVDGLVGRVKKTTSKFGAYLDNYIGLWCDFILIISFCICMTYLDKSLVWLYLMLPLFFFMLLHFIESLMVVKIIGIDKYKSVKPQTKYRIVEPLNTSDCLFIVFILSPLWYYLDLMLWIVSVIISLLILKQIFWFVYYKNKLEDKR